jgi:hypothetical protein
MAVKRGVSMTTDRPETLVNAYVRFGRIEEGFGCRIRVRLAPCWACIIRDDDCERQYVELAVGPDAGEAHGQTFAMTFEPEDAERIGLELVRRARALVAVPVVGEAEGTRLGE